MGLRPDSLDGIPPPQEKKLFLLDGHALVYRAYFTFAARPMVNSKGVDTGCVYGFVNTLLHLLTHEHPTHLSVAFDTPVSFRRSLYKDYKANREKQPAPIQEGLPWVYEILDALGVPTCKVADYEADDIIATLAVQAAARACSVYVVSPDKDFVQIVDKNIRLYRPGRGGKPADIVGLEHIHEKFGIDHPMQITDKLALQGDAVDNIPGIPGIGEKTAIRLLEAYGTVEALLAQSDGLSERLKRSILPHKERLLDYKRLVTLVRDAPVAWEEEHAKIKGFDERALRSIFEVLEFNSLSRRLLDTPYTRRATQ